jgi:hypothetical protein
MTTFHAVMVDETGCEFGVGVTAGTRMAAYAKLRDDYPESRCVQLESPKDRAKRERALQAWEQRCYDGEVDDRENDYNHY